MEGIDLVRQQRVLQTRSHFSRGEGCNAVPVKELPLRFAAFTAASRAHYIEALRRRRRGRRAHSNKKHIRYCGVPGGSF
jgi:hypothetical protein